MGRNAKRALVAFAGLLMVLAGLGTPSYAAKRTTPMAVAIAAGWGHTCALMRDRTVECWGNNDHGQLGRTTPGDNRSSSPAPVTDLTGATAITVGENHTCALLTDGTVKCWGLNDHGQLGDGSTTDAASPQTVTGLAGVTAIDSGDDHVCALIGDGTVKCWGWNENGQVGDATLSDRLTAVLVEGVKATALAAGSAHTCVLTGRGSVTCWGRNVSGQVGLSSMQLSNSPTPVPDVAGASVLAAGASFTCVVTKKAVLMCWGSNADGQLGLDPTTERLPYEPVVLTGLDRTADIAAGDYHMCSITPKGAVWCWGDNWAGGLGNGSTVPSWLPQLVGTSEGALTRVDSVAAGGSHTCSLSRGAIKCWGDNTFGQIGNGNLIQQLRPVDVVFTSAA